MPDIKNWASIIPLDYSTPDQRRLEFSVGFLSTDWESLKDLLAAPNTFLADKQALWPQTNEHPLRLDQPVEWKLLSPVTMRITPARGNLPAVIKSAKSLGVSVEDAQREAFASLGGSALDRDAATKMVEILSKKVSDLAPDGAYLAEFAPYTYMLRIHYWPPHHCAADTAKSAAEPFGEPTLKRHTEPFTKPTVGLIGDTNIAGMLHFDVGLGNDVRARFIMDHIENSARTCQRLNAMAREMRGVNTQFVPEGEPILVRELGLRRDKPINILQTPGSAMDTRAPSVRLTDDATITPEVTFPSLFVDGVSEDDTPCDCCCNQDITETDSALVAGDMDVKVYCPDAVEGTTHARLPATS